MPKIGVEILSYHATQYLEKVLKQYAWVDKIAVLSYRFNSTPESEDNTEDIVRSFKHKDIIFEKGQGLPQHGIRNRGLELLRDCGVVFISDADEFIFRKDQEKIISAVINKGVEHKPSNYCTCTIVDYNGDLYHGSPERSYYTTVAVSPKDVLFGHLRSIGHDNKCACLPEVKMHHLGLVFPEHILSWKAVWEGKEEKVPLEKVLSDWSVRREITPPQELLEMLKNE